MSEALRDFKKAQQGAAELSNALLRTYSEVDVVHEEDEARLRQSLEKSGSADLHQWAMDQLKQSHDVAKGLCEKWKEVADLVQALVPPLVIQGLSKKITGIQEKLEIKIKVDEKNETLLLRKEPDFEKKVRRSLCWRMLRRFELVK